MAGGTWTAQNKVRPGVYINFESEPAPLGSIGERGTVTMPLALSWGLEKAVVTITATTDVRTALGYDLTDAQLLLVKEALKRARTLLVYRVNTGVKASATQGTVTVTAKYSGVRGNDIAIQIQNDIDVPSNFVVQTRVGSTIVDTQKVAALANLKNNDFVVFGGTGSLTTTVWKPLTGGTDGTATNTDYTDYLRAIEPYRFDAMALPSTDTTLKATFVAFAKRLRDNEGTKFQLVLENYPTADSEGVISVKNGVVLTDSTVIDAAKATTWVAAATAAANPNQSLTYAKYDGASDVTVRYTADQITAALLAGEFVFTFVNGAPVVEQDINTFLSYTPTKRKHYSKNRVVRVLDDINNDIRRIFETYYIGKIDNNADGANLLKGEIMNYLEALQKLNALKNVRSEDISILPATDGDAVAITLNVQPVDAIEKIYMKVVAK